jgi:hypothetical protein
MLFESGIYAMFGGISGLAMAYAGLWLLKYSLASKIPRLLDAGLNGPVLLFALGLVLMSTLLFSLAPMLVLNSGEVYGTLKEAGRSGNGGLRRQRLRSLLIA